MTPCDPYSDVIVHTMQWEWTFRVNQAEVLREDLRFLRSLIPKRHVMAFLLNTNSNQRKTINMIRQENNRMAIRCDRYYMLQNFRQIVEETGKMLDSSIVNNITSMREHYSDVEMSDEESPMYMHLQWSYSCMHDNVNNPLLYNYLFVMVAYELLSY